MVKLPFKSRRVRPVEQPQQPAAPPFGWSDPSPDSGASHADPYHAEKAARLAGVGALLQLEAQRVERAKAARDENLRGVRLGRNYSDPASY
jgi:hypothetical protein